MSGHSVCVWYRRHYTVAEFIHAVIIIIIITVAVVVVVVITQRLQIFKDCASRRYADSRLACIGVSMQSGKTDFWRVWLGLTCEFILKSGGQNILEAIKRTSIIS